VQSADGCAKAGAVTALVVTPGACEAPTALRFYDRIDFPTENPRRIPNSRDAASMATIVITTLVVASIPERAKIPIQRAITLPVCI